MFRALFVIVILAFGIRHAVRGPFYALLLYMFLAYFRPEEWLWNADLFRALNMSFFVGVFTLLAAFFGGQVRLSGASLLICLFAFQAFLSTTLSPHAAYAWPFMMQFIKAAMMTWLVASLTTNVKRLRLVLIVIGLSLGFEAAKQGWAQLLLNPGARNENTIALLGDNNGVAVGLWVLAAILIALARTTTVRWHRWVFHLLTIGVVYRSLSTYSRGGFLCAIVVGVVFIIRAKRRVLPILVLAVLTAGVATVLPPEFWERIHSISDVPITEEPVVGATTGDDADVVSAASRVHFWRVAVLMANSRPMVGVGLNAYKATFDQFDFLNGLYGTGRAVHSSWFGTLADLGYPGLILLVALMGKGLWTCRRVRRQKATDPESQELREYAIALETGLLVVLVGGSFVTFQYVELYWHVMGLTIALDQMTLHRSPVHVPVRTAPSFA